VDRNTPAGSEARRANVVGLGLIGGSVALALSARGWTVTGEDADPDRVDAAVLMGAIAAGGLDPDASLTFVATPASAVPDLVKQALASTSGVVTDVASVKAPVAAAVTDERFCGGHPMAGSELDGLDGADAAMFEGAVWVLTPTAATSDTTFATVARVVSDLGAEVVALPPERHDALVAVVSHVPHLAAAALMTMADERAEEHAALLRLAAGGFRDMTRIAAGQPGLWIDICAENRPAIVERWTPWSIAWASSGGPLPTTSATCSSPSSPGPAMPGSTSPAAWPRARTWPRSARLFPTAPAPRPRSSPWPPSSGST